MTTISSPAATLPYHQREWIDVEPGQYDNKSCFEVSKKDDQVASTRLVSTSRRRWSSQIQNLGSDVSFRIYVLSALVNSNMTELLKRDFSIVWIHTLLRLFYPFEQFKAPLEENTSIHHCRTTCSDRATSSSVSTTLEAPTICTRSFNQDWFRVAIHLHKQRDDIVTKPRIAVYKHNGKRHQNRVFLCSSRVAHSERLKFYPTRSNAIILYNTLLAVCIEKWWSGSHRRRIVQPNVSVSCCTAKKCTEADLALWTPTSSDARTSFDHSSKHNEDCDVGTDKETCRGEKRLQNQPFGCPRARSYPPGSSPKVDSSVRDASE